MNFLLLDIGNTSIAYSITKNGKVTDIHRVENQENINKFMRLFDFSHIDKTLICSVAPSISDSVVDVLKYKDVDYFEINYTHAKTKLLVDKPSEVGNDRICNIMGAKVINAPAIIIDFGTATTYDIINENGDFIGGAISPGIDIDKCKIKNYLKKNLSKIITDLDLFFEMNKKNLVISITGTNGKSTTCKIIEKILEKETS